MQDRGNEMYKARRYRDAIGYYDKGIKLSPHPLLYSNSRATAYAELNSYNAALKDIELAIRCWHDRMEAVKTGEREEDRSMLTRVYKKKMRSRITVSSRHDRERRILELSSGDLPDARKGIEEKLAAIEDALRDRHLEEGLREIFERMKEDSKKRLEWARRMDDAKEETANGDRMFQEGNFYNKAEAADPKAERRDAYLLYSNRSACSIEMKRGR
eukprot:764084-Hanusia_phi.AAC.4